MPRHVELTSAGTFCCAVAPMLDRLDASVRQIRVGASRPRGLRKPDDLARHTLLEEDDHRPSAEFLSWRPGLRQPAPAVTEPQRWICLNFTYQQLQAAMAGQDVALARLSLVHESLARGELVEPFGPSLRVTSPCLYWRVPWPGRRKRPKLAAFEAWVVQQARPARTAVISPSPHTP